MNIQDKNGWMVPSHNGYLEFPAQDDTPIAVTVLPPRAAKRVSGTDAADG